MARMGIEMQDQQRAVCLQVGAPNFECNLQQKVGISRNVKEGLRPLNGLRIQPEGRCCINQGRGEAVLTFTRNDMAVTL
ncbi:hypothetical protein GO293_04967 [Ralstonia solanacearum]|nr:hypothetical protein [Ralstonia solanacearum]